MKKHIETLSDWIESREVRGYYTFTKEDIEKQFPSAGKVYIKTALYRLAAKAKIVSPWRNFYVIMPVMRLHFMARHIKEYRHFPSWWNNRA